MGSRKLLPVPKDAQHDVRGNSGGGTVEEALASAAALMAELRQLPCPHCRSDNITHWGAAHGFPRYRCGSCRRTFNILTKTPLARLRNKNRWPTFVGAMIERRSIRRSAAACGVSVTTSSRWHKRFLECTAAQRAKIIGEVIAVLSNTSALTAGPGNTSAADLAWARELLPVVLSWLV
jgi:transposase-like protein